jgi:hypothetical protein
MKNTKLEICNKCWGTGHVHGGDDNSTWTKTCEYCKGIGFIRVHMTNADRIRAMTDEELAEWLARTQIEAIKDAMTILRLPYDESDEIVEMGKAETLEWLQQPAKGDA